MSKLFILGVPDVDRAELSGLARELDLPGELAEQRYFDGADFLEIVVVGPSLSAAAWLTLRTWITARAERHKSTRVTADGIEIVGASPEDAIRLIEALERTRGEGAESGDVAR